MTHICISNLTIIASDNDLSPGRRQAIIYANAGILLIGTSEILREIHTFSLKKHLKMSSVKQRQFCLSLNVWSLKWILGSINSNRNHAEYSQCGLTSRRTVHNTHNHALSAHMQARMFCDSKQSYKLCNIRNTSRATSVKIITWNSLSVFVKIEFRYCCRIGLMNAAIELTTHCK